MTYTRDVRFTGNRFENLGGAGVKLVKGTRNTRIEGNRFAEIGDCGILVYTGGDIHAETEDADQCCDDVIRSNYIENTGRETVQGTGITVVDAQRIRVEHNEITGTPAAGISFGYFNTDKALSVGNVCAANYIHDVVTQVDDQAGIYVYGTRFDLPPNPPGNTLLVTGNLIENVVRGPYQDGNPIAAMYLGRRGARRGISRQRPSQQRQHHPCEHLEHRPEAQRPRAQHGRRPGDRGAGGDRGPAMDAGRGALAQKSPGLSRHAAARALSEERWRATFPRRQNAGRVASRRPSGRTLHACVWAKLEQTGGVQTLFGNARDGKGPGFRVAVSGDGKILVHDSDGKRGHDGATGGAGLCVRSVEPCRGRDGAVGQERPRVRQRRGRHPRRPRGQRCVPERRAAGARCERGGGDFSRGALADFRLYAGKLRPRRSPRSPPPRRRPDENPLEEGSES
jgi:hypothetical protein